MDWLDLLAIQETLKSLLQHHSSKASILQCSAFFIVQLSHPYMTIGKTIALTRQTFVGKVMSCLENPRDWRAGWAAVYGVAQSRTRLKQLSISSSSLVIAFLPWNKHLLISWLQSPFAVILEPRKIKSVIVSTVSPSICHEVMGLDAMIFVF